MHSRTDRIFAVVCIVLLGVVFANRVAEERVPAWDERGAAVNAVVLGVIMLTLGVKGKVEKSPWPDSFLLLGAVALVVATWMALN